MAKIYVESKDDVRSAIARSGQRLSAVELTGAKLRDSWRRRFHQSFERNRVGAIAAYWRGEEKGRKGVTYG